MSLFTRMSILLILIYASALLIGQEALSIRIANYEMDVRLDTSSKTIDGTTVLTWTNPSDDTIRELQFHLYLNAFKSNQSTWMREEEYFSLMAGQQWFEKCNWGWIAVNNMQDSRGNELSGGFEFIRPEDGNVFDETVLRVPLREPILPKANAVFRYSWSSRIPRAAIRTGYNMDYYFMAQWFPKLGVYEPAGMRYAKEGQWNCHQYHANSEYYSDFGVYDVKITVPESFVVGASGVLLNKESSGENTIWHYRAEDVIDFTWSTSPHFLVYKERWNDVDIDLYLYPEHKPLSSRFTDPMKYALEFLSEHIGDYPYPNITIVAPPVHGIFAGPMEYPTLITAFGSVLLPGGLRMTETLVVHEFVHQYFMQMVASNEQEEAWLDEGLTSYIESQIMDQYYGIKTSLAKGFGMQCGNLEYARHNCIGSGIAFVQPGNLNSWEYTADVYNNVSYDRPVLWLKTLEGLLGKELMWEVLRTYFETWKFRHPCGDDFIDVVNQVVIGKVDNK